MKHLFITTEQKLLATFLLSSFFFLLSTVSAHAGVISIQTESKKFHLGDVFTIDVVVNSEGQTLNAVATDVVFPNELLEYVKDNDAKSVLSLWVEDPELVETSTVHLSGITPGGFNEPDAQIVSLTFKVIGQGQGNIETSNAQLLLHDGLGTQAMVKAENVHVSIVEGTSLLSVNAVDDEDPENFTPTITSDPDVFNGAYFMTFATEDKGSGLHHFEVKEGLFGSYVVATSPYKLKHQSRDVKVYVKAIDANGNQRIVIVYPQNKEAWYQNKNAIAGILIVCVLTLLMFLFYTRKRLHS